MDACVGSLGEKLTGREAQKHHRDPDRFPSFVHANAAAQSRKCGKCQLPVEPAARR
jgi:hypothetical protein